MSENEPTPEPKNDTPSPETPSTGTGATGIPGADKKLLAGIIGISSVFWGGFGVHKFILGYTKEGIITAAITIVTCGIGGAILGLIEGIIYVTKTDQEFVDTYIKNQKPWF
ncbi:MAG: TM2 domain-containing protein [Verrucomicrobiota bacterium]